MRRHFRKRPNPCCCTTLYDMPKYTGSTDLSLLVSNSLNPSSLCFFHPHTSLPCQRGDMMNMQMSDWSSCIGPMSCLQRPAHIFQSNLSPSLASAFQAVIPRVILVVRDGLLGGESFFTIPTWDPRDDLRVSCFVPMLVPCALDPMPVHPVSLVPMPVCPGASLFAPAKDCVSKRNLLFTQ